MKSMMRFALVFAILLPLAACAGNPAPAEGTSNPDQLTREEIAGVQGARSLYDVVLQLRPRWLQVRSGERSFGLTTNIVVFQDQSYLGDVDTLRQLSPEVAYGMRWLDGTTASATLSGLGSQHVAGAIIISTHPG